MLAALRGQTNRRTAVVLSIGKNDHKYVSRAEWEPSREMRVGRDTARAVSKGASSICDLHVKKMNRRL